MVKKRITILFLLILTALALYLSFILFRPFLKPLLTAVVIAVVFFPVQARMLQVVRSPSLSALFSTILVTSILTIPAVMLGAAIFNEVTHLYEFLDQKSEQSGGLSPFLMQTLDRPLQWLGQYVDISKIDVRGYVAGRLQQISGFLLGETRVIVGNLTSFIINTAITLFTLFFMFREGRSMRRRAAAYLPLRPDQVEKLFNGVSNTLIATVYGGLVVAAVQGGLVGLALWIFGVPSPVLWGVVAAFFALLPLVGTAAVWIPASIYLMATGHPVKGLILIGWGAGVVGTVDNFLRPYLISGRVQMHTLLIFFSVFGGIQLFGFLGLFVGPVILAVTSTLLSLLRDESRNWQQLWLDNSDGDNVEPAAMTGGPATAPSAEADGRPREN
ncbi:MAG TPA: AI-2E family transporter [Blastocatellia bacterium]|nr:AI-2E family transporter [Blastocatellia bacterium]